MTSCHCCTTGKKFDGRTARHDLRRFRRYGPYQATARLLAAAQQAALPDQASLLDIGGGIGAIHHVLLDRGFSRATHVDASQAYLDAAADEAARLGHADRVTFVYGDFSTLGAGLAPADLVTLDRVVCCDPDYVGLLGAAADHARRLLAFTYPRARWAVRLAIAASNRWRSLVGDPFRVYLHSPAAMRGLLEQRGFRRSWTGGTWLWAAELFERAA
jgi:hypothetical protein